MAVSSGASHNRASTVVRSRVGGEASIRVWQINPQDRRSLHAQDELPIHIIGGVDLVFQVGRCRGKHRPDIVANVAIVRQGLPDRLLPSIGVVDGRAHRRDACAASPRRKSSAAIAGKRITSAAFAIQLTRKFSASPELSASPWAKNNAYTFHHSSLARSRLSAGGVAGARHSSGFLFAREIILLSLGRSSRAF